MAKEDSESTEADDLELSDQDGDALYEGGSGSEDVWIGLNSFTVGRLWKWRGKAIEEARHSSKEGRSEISQESQGFEYSSSQKWVISSISSFLESTAKKGKEGSNSSADLCVEKGAKKELTEKQGYEVVLRYINEQNKPFNAQTIFENLHKEVKKAYVVRILAQLAQESCFVCGIISSGKIIEKEFGKSKVYFADQSQFPEIDEAEFKKMDQEITGLEEEEKSLQSEVGMLKNGLLLASLEE